MKRGIRTFRSALDFLSSQVNYERTPRLATAKSAFGLSRISRLLHDLGNPHKKLRCAHIAGTKGKGSTATMLACMLQNNGLRVGLYTSPHLLDVRERITINGKMISEAEFARHMARIAVVTEGFRNGGGPTYFEILTALALRYFADQEVDLAVIETGIGGRLDATNIIEPIVCGLTSISYDHTELLGRTLADIAGEKAGIIKKGVPVVSAPQTKEVKNVFRKAAETMHSRLSFVGNEIEFTYRFESSRVAGPQARICVSTENGHFDHLAVPLVGEHQAMNCAVAVGMLSELKAAGIEVDDEAAVAGLARVRMPGRMETFCTEPRVLADAAHNAASIEAVMRAIGQNVSYDSMVVIFGCCADKDVRGMLQHILLGADKIIFTRIDSPRSADPHELTQIFAEITNGRMAQIAPTLAEAMEIAEKAVTREDLICITGSFYLVAAAKRFFAEHPHRPESTTILPVPDVV